MCVANKANVTDYDCLRSFHMLSHKLHLGNGMIPSVYYLFVYFDTSETVIAAQLFSPSLVFVIAVSSRSLRKTSVPTHLYQHWQCQSHSSRLAHPLREALYHSDHVLNIFISVSQSSRNDHITSSLHYDSTLQSIVSLIMVRALAWSSSIPRADGNIVPTSTGFAQPLVSLASDMRRM